MGATCSNKKPCKHKLVNNNVKTNNDDYTVPLSDGRKVHNRYIFVTKFIKPQTYQNGDVDDQCSIEQHFQKIIPSIRSGDDVFVIQFQPSQVISLDIRNQELNSSLKTSDKCKPQKLHDRRAMNLLDSFEIISIIK